MKRRELLGILGGAAIWPLSARARQAVPVIGFLQNASFTANRPQVSAFWEGAELTGFADHRNVTAEYRWAEGHDDLLPDLASDLVGQDVSVIVAGGGDSAVMAAKRATATIPIVFISGSDPVRSGFVTSLNQPDDNITGLSLATPELLAKRFEVLHELAPQLSSFAALVNPENSNIAVQLRYLMDSTRRTGIPVPTVNASQRIRAWRRA